MSQERVCIQVKEMTNKVMHSLSQHNCILLPHFVHHQTQIYPLLFYPRSVLRLHMTNHHIKGGHFQVCHTSLCLLVSDKTAIFPFIYFRLSMLCVAFVRAHATHTHTQTRTRKRAQLHTHTFSFSVVINNVLMAILRLLTRSQPINQTIQLAYDHNKYALDECLAVQTQCFPEAQSRRTNVIENRQDEAEVFTQAVYSSCGRCLISRASYIQASMSSSQNHVPQTSVDLLDMHIFI